MQPHCEIHLKHQREFVHQTKMNSSSQPAPSQASKRLLLSLLHHFTALWLVSSRSPRKSSKHLIPLKIQIEMLGFILLHFLKPKQKNRFIHINKKIITCHLNPVQSISSVPRSELMRSSFFVCSYLYCSLKFIKITAAISHRTTVQNISVMQSRNLCFEVPSFTHFYSAFFLSSSFFFLFLYFPPLND